MSSPSRGLPPRPVSGHAGANLPQTTHHHQHQMPYAYPPYCQPNMSSHYAQAYTQYIPTTTPESYSLSSSFVAQANASSPSASSPSNQASSSGLNSRPRWPEYQRGNHRCSKQGCAFTGSQKAVEIHMMDRHLIYPPGWNSRKRKSDWDADPSLKGKQVTIQGTSVALDTDEAIAAWIAERKNRFPTAERIASKQRKMEEAVARGQLDIQAMHPSKRRMLDHKGGGRGRGTGRGRGRGREGFLQRDRRAPGDAESMQVQHQSQLRHSLPKKPEAEASVSLMGMGQDAEAAPLASSMSDSDSDDDAPPEVASSTVKIDPHSQKTETPTEQDKLAPKSRQYPPPSASTLIKKPTAKQPRRPPQNPFASRPALLRNLLLPEIRMTMSNLSQAVRFLVDNNFLEGVELSPSEGEKMIEVISETQANLETKSLDDGTGSAQ